METCEIMLGKTQRRLNCNSHAGLKVRWVRADASSVARHQPWFLRSLGIVHGYLKGVRYSCFPCLDWWRSHPLPPRDNILVDRPGCARLADFGLASAGPHRTEALAPWFMGTQQWTSPELLGANEGSPRFSTRKSDSSIWGWSLLR